MKKLLFTIALGVISYPIFADVITDELDANSFGWNECAFESSNGSSVIDKGVLTIKSKGENKAAGAFLTAMTGVATKVGANTFFETHCYAPLDMSADFEVTTDVTIDKLDNDRLVGLVFNYRDAGNFYCFSFNDEMVSFRRYVDNAVVGNISQSVIWKKTKKAQQQWKLTKVGDELAFSVDDMEILRVRYMPLEYAGFGFYTFGKQKLVVDKIVYQQ